MTSGDVMLYDGTQFIKYYADLSLASKNNPEIIEMRKAMDTVDSKCASLLTHVSVMIACSVFLQTATVDSPWLNTFFLIETAGYIVVALILLFCLNFIGAHTRIPAAHNLNSFHAVVVWRRILLYRVSLNLTILITVALLFTVIVKIV